MVEPAIDSYRDLRVWQKAMELAEVLPSHDPRVS